MRSPWDEGRAAELSRHPAVRRAMVLGTVLAVELRSSGGGGGYGGGGAAPAAVVARLRAAGVYARPLGPVVYLMVTPMTRPETCSRLLGQLEAALHE